MPDPRYERLPLSAVIERFEAGVSVRSDDRPALEGEHGVLKVSCVSRAGFRPKENKVVLAEELSRLGPTPNAGDLLLTRANTVELVALAVMVDLDYPYLHLSDKHWRVVLRHPKDDSLSWVKHLVNSAPVRQALVSRATGTSGSMKNVSQQQFLKILVLCPPGHVQRRVGITLDLFDRADAMLGRLIDAKRRFKRGLVKEMLAGKRRSKEFEGAPRHTVRVGEVAREVTERAGEEQQQLPVVSCSKHEGLVDSLHYFGKQVFSVNRATYKVVRRNQFAYPSNHIEEGSIGLLEHHDAALVSPIYTVFEAVPDVVPEYLYLLFKTEAYRQLFSKNTNASVNRRGSLRWKQFRALAVALPPFDEQQRISALSGLLDREIDGLERLRDALDRERRGVAALLLTGKVRVPETPS